MTAEVRIASRRAFSDALERAREAVHRFALTEAENPVWPFAARMLEVMAVQTDGGREPSLRERRAAKLGALVDREMQPAPTADHAALNELLLAVNLYFVVWPANGIDPEEMPEEDYLDRM